MIWKVTRFAEFPLPSDTLRADGRLAGDAAEACKAKKSCRRPCAVLALSRLSCCRMNKTATREKSRTSSVTAKVELAGVVEGDMVMVVVIVEVAVGVGVVDKGEEADDDDLLPPNTVLNVKVVAKTVEKDGGAGRAELKPVPAPSWMLADTVGETNGELTSGGPAVAR